MHEVPVNYLQAACAGAVCIEGLINVKQQQQSTTTIQIPTVQVFDNKCMSSPSE